MKQQYFIIDFDSTFVQTESLEDLAKVALVDHPNRDMIVAKIGDLTNHGMTGTMSLRESLQKRLQLLSAKKSHIRKTVSLLRKNISPSFIRNKKFFKKFGKNIFIVSGGFKELVIPIVKPFGIPEKNVFANTFLFNYGDDIVGIDKNNPLCSNGGKATVVQSLHLIGDIFIVGDGVTDFEAKQHVKSGQFIAFTENIIRENVVKKADKVVKNFDEVLMFTKEDKVIAKQII